jgi:hypothetical protein
VDPAGLTGSVLHHARRCGGAPRTTWPPAQLYLLDDPLLKEPLKPEDIKKKIVGHWGTVPGQNFIYTCT